MRDNNSMGGILVEVWNCRLGCTTSPIQAKVIPRLVGIDTVISEGFGYCIREPPSPLNTMISGLVAGGTVCMGTIGGEKIVVSRGGVGGGKQKSTLSPHNWKDIVPVYTSITASAVVRNDLPKMIGAWELSSISRSMKSHGITNLPT